MLTCRRIRRDFLDDVADSSPFLSIFYGSQALTDKALSFQLKTVGAFKHCDPWAEKTKLLLWPHNLAHVMSTKKGSKSKKFCLQLASSISTSMALKLLSTLTILIIACFTYKVWEKTKVPHNIPQEDIWKVKTIEFAARVSHKLVRFVIERSSPSHRQTWDKVTQSEWVWVTLTAISQS